jgi:hypothetical protein
MRKMMRRTCGGEKMGFIEENSRKSSETHEEDDEADLRDVAERLVSTVPSNQQRGGPEPPLHCGLERPAARRLVLERSQNDYFITKKLKN